MSSSPRTHGDNNSQAYHVEPPRTGDAIGLALRDAYVRDSAIPEDMAALLRDLNAVPETGAPRE